MIDFLFAALAAPDFPPGEPPPHSGPPPLLAFLPLWFGGTISLTGGAWLVTLLMPEATALAAQRCTGVRRFLVGALILLATVAVLGGLLLTGFKPMRGLLITILASEASLGLAATARLLGARIAPAASPVMQSWLGLAGLMLPLATPLGLPVLAVAAPLGLGAWLARRAEA